MMKRESQLITRTETDIRNKVYETLNDLGISILNHKEFNIFISALVHTQNPIEIEEIVASIKTNSLYEKNKIYFYLEYIIRYLKSSDLHERDNIILLLATTFMDSIHPDLNYKNFNDYVIFLNFKNLFKKLFIK